ncbi:hypothetical protein FIV42_19595 [Persicimonas caeni]|uniref:Uncharacterized protein n=1 Tax=Persicimonas caeni TaxID=2292766 RepID=A0A4Y6PX30_PERCE|nr:hypothetical protein [Persicimonas caeni]QDG52866.1 hypothetical protein FIV42_19595 [Persicimonas caeni]QED34088.1 hypothetical protein FRD00_19590 [Persicimonas caeni]
MTIAETDTRLQKALKERRDAIAAFSFEGRPKVWADEAVSVLDGVYVKFTQAVQNEDAQEVEATETQAQVAGARVELNTSFRKMADGYQMRLAELNLTGEFDDTAMELGEYLSNMPPSEFNGVDIEMAVSAVERARRYGDRFLPEGYRDQINQRVDDALAKVKAAREAASREEGEANAAFTELEAAREEAKAGYTSARDLLRAALRQSGRIDRLDTLMPSIWRVLRGTPQPANEPEPEDEPTPVA